MSNFYPPDVRRIYVGSAVVKDDAAISALMQVRAFINIVAVLPAYAKRFLEGHAGRQMKTVANRRALNGNTVQREGICMAKPPGEIKEILSSSAVNRRFRLAVNKEAVVTFHIAGVVHHQANEVAFALDVDSGIVFTDWG